MNTPPKTPAQPASVAQNWDSDASWTYSRSYAAMLLPIPSLISTAVSSLWQDHLVNREAGQNLNSCSRRTFNNLRLIERSGKLKAPIYFAASSLYPKELQELREDDVIKALVTVLGPGMFAGVLALVYLHRRLMKVCTHEYWQTLSKEMVLSMELGWVIGSAVPKLGPADGMLAGGIRYAGVAPYLIKTPDHFKKYRINKRRQFDIEYEHQTWECDHAQVAAYLLKELGFCSDLRRSSHALRKLPDNELCTLPKELTTLRSAVRFIDAIRRGEDPATHGEELSLSPDETIALRVKTHDLLQGTSQFGWMFKTSQSEVEEPGSDKPSGGEGS